MTTTQLRRFNYRVLKLALALEKSAKPDHDQALLDLAEKLNDTWQALYRLEKARELEEARRKDKGVVLWEVFCPRTSNWHRQKVITCTPNRIIETSDCSGDVHERVADGSDAYKRLALTIPPVDTRLMVERQRLVESKPRHFWVWDLDKEAA